MLKAYQTLTCTLFLLPAIALAENALLTGKADEALAALRTRLQIDPADAEAHNLMCRVYYQLERWDDSVHACERAVNLQPRNSEYHQWLGRAYGRRGEASGPGGALFMVRKVKAEFERAAALNADSLSARAALAQFYMEAPFFMGGDKTKARQLADYVAQPDPAQGQFMLAQIDEKKNKPKPETEFKSAVRASGGRADYWFELASFYRRSGRPEEMQLAVDKASDLSSKDPIVLFFCAR